MKSKILLFLLFCTFSSFAQIQITGKVIDKGNEPLPGVTVIIGGTTQGIVTGMDGTYVLPNVSSDATLVFSYIGMRTQEIVVGNQSTINVSLEEETIGIDEVIAVGYGTMKKSDISGSIVSVNVSELQSTPIASIDQGLVGRAAGVVVTQGTGLPGGMASIRIRGTTSLNGQNEPLYVIDGFPISTGSIGDTGGGSDISALATLNPNDIESLEILKDASATAIYGARAANGVVLITTKTGKKGRTKISYENYFGTQKVVKKLDMMNALEFAELSNEARQFSNNEDEFDAEQMAAIRANPEGTDWHDLMFRNAFMQNHQLSLSGGSDKTTFMVSVNYFSQEGVLKNSVLDRISLRVNLDHKVNDKFSVGIRTTNSRTNSNLPPTNTLFGSMEGVRFSPVEPVYLNEELNEYNEVNPYSQIANPVATLNEYKLDNSALRFLGNVYGEYEITDGLKFKVSFGADILSQRNKEFIPSNIYQSLGVAKAKMTSRQNLRWLNENIFSYVKTFNGIHNINAVAGITFEGSENDSFTASDSDFTNNILGYYSLGLGTLPVPPAASYTKTGFISYLARVVYNLDQKYIVSLTSRYDGASRFGEDNKYGYFPSAAFAWRASEEQFVKDLNVFSNLKFRFSYGRTGNMVGAYSSLPTMDDYFYMMNGQLITGFSASGIPDPGLQWEKSDQYSAAIDFGFLDNRIQFTAEGYYRKTFDLLADVQIPFTTGFEDMTRNIGSIENKGLDFELKTLNIDRAFKWSTNFNISFVKNKVLELGGEPYVDLGGIHRLIVGEEVGTFFGWVFDGIIQNQEELDAVTGQPLEQIGGAKMKDISGPDGVPDGNIDDLDRMVIGDSNADFVGGMTNTFTYKGFDLNIFMQYSYGNDLYNSNYENMTEPSGRANALRVVLDRWTPDNPSNKYMRANINPSTYLSSESVEDASYLKIKTISLGYNVPNLRSKLIKNLKVYATAQNMFTFTNYSGYDPEVSSRGGLRTGEDGDVFPQSKSMIFGIKVDF